MHQRRSLKIPITLAVIMLGLLVVLTVGWVLLNVFGAKERPGAAGWHWALLTIGTGFIAILIMGVVVYLILSVKAINLNRRQSNFIDSVTHEFKSPMASMKLYLQTLRRHHVDHKQQEKFYRFMVEDLDRLDRLINQMLDAGKMESVSITGEAEDVALVDLMKSCADTVCLSYRVSPKTVAWDIEPCVIRARRVDLELIFRNLLDNAVKYAGVKPEVQVTLTSSDNSHITVQIADNGCGIPTKQRQKIFGRFVRLGVELERENIGTGLGLYIVRTVVKRLRGRIQIHDHINGSGTIFEVQLPKRA